MAQLSAKHRRLPDWRTLSSPAENPLQASFERGLSFQHAGDARMAEQIRRNALGRFADDGNLLCLLGAALIRQP